MVCDLQEKFAPSIINFDTIVQNTDRIVQAANLLQIPILATEQYPKVIKISMYTSWRIGQFLGITYNRYVIMIYYSKFDNFPSL